ncbi:MAG TPA: RecQ family ATP-dependent DNA helicase [Rectinemataceae bacterium]
MRQIDEAEQPEYREIGSECAASLEDPVSRIAAERFGVSYLYPLQRMAMANILDSVHRDEPFRQLVLFPTGFGKSLCFQLPALLLPGLTLVVYPLLALMNDQKRSLEKRGIASCLIRGGMDETERLSCMKNLEEGRYKILITNPESLIQPKLAAFLERLGIFHAAVDEAHCVSEWGETFRPSYLELGSCLTRLKPKVLSAFTATASPVVASAIVERLFGKENYSLVTADMDKPNLKYSVCQTGSASHSLCRLLGELPKPAIVFGQSRAGVRRICEMASERTGLETRFYHAGLSRQEKEDTEAWFLGSKDGVLAATCAYGMGVDKKDIRTVIHFSSPSSAEAYIQEAGRGGRDGEACRAILIHDVLREGEDTEIESKNRDKSPTGPDLSRKARSESFRAYPRGRGCRRESLLAMMGSSLESPCSGCDVCEGEARSEDEAEGLVELFAFLKAHPGRFSKADCIRLLLGDEKGEPPCCAGSGALSSWEPKDLRALLTGALAKKLVIQAERGFRKGRLYPHL